MGSVFAGAKNRKAPDIWVGTAFGSNFTTASKHTRHTGEPTLLMPSYDGISVIKIDSLMGGTLSHASKHFC